MKQHILKILAVGLVILNLFSCAPEQGIPAIDEPETEELDHSALAEILAEKNSAQLQTAMNIRTLKNGILEYVEELPSGAKIEVSDNYQVYLNEYRDSNGQLKRSSTGFVSPVKLVSVPSAFTSRFTKAYIQKLNSTSSGLYISAATLVADQGSAGNFNVIKPAAAGTGFLKLYSSNGKPKFNYVTSITKRFGARLNKAVTSSNSQKWNAIYNELKKVAHRTVATPKSYLFMEDSKAQAAFLNFEKSYIVPKYGAWTIATEYTAVKHGFPNVPCAEFQSEILRQAYTRAGYNVLNDFSTQKGNILFWNNTSSVKRLSDALYKAGWVPWTTNKYKPLVGAIMFHGAGGSPGHTYISGGNDGQIIVDNGAPQGRDLRKTSQATIDIQYQSGFFFLPPGINPQAW